MHLQTALQTAFIALNIFIKFTISEKIVPYIFGGKPASIKEFPWQVALYQNDIQSCGASIIGRSYILTAAHCVFFGGKGVTFNVLYGTDHLKRGGHFVKVIRILMHQHFDITKADNDVAVLVIETPILFSHLASPVKLRGAAVRPGEHAVVTGFGATETDENPLILYKAAVSIINWNHCSRVYNESGMRPTKNQICALGPKQDSCIGDSGGPLVIGKAQVGIVSWGPNKCATKGAPGVYTKLSKYKNFVQKATKHTAQWI